ncbi:MAG: hypothetical protein OES09_00040 [Gammaproteobacteria bacterium]|nr:hypothetical protein [Gammaproteobacteria bacterium]
MPINKAELEISAKNATKRAFDEVDRSLGGLATKAGDVGKVIAASMAVAGTALVLMTKRALDTADAIGKGADQAGIAVETYQELAAVGELAAISQGEMDSALGAFNKRLGEAQVGTGALTTHLRKYDAGMLDSLKATNSTEEALELFLKTLANVKDPAERAALAAAAFGRTVGIKVANLVKDGEVAFNDLRGEIREVVTIMTEDQVRASEAANDAMTKLTKAIGNLITGALAKLAPAIERVANFLTQQLAPALDIVIEAMDSAWRVANDLADGLSILVGGATGAEIAIRNYATQVAIATTKTGEWVDSLVRAKQGLESLNAAEAQRQIGFYTRALRENDAQQKRVSIEIERLTGILKDQGDAGYGRLRQKLAAYEAELRALQSEQELYTRIVSDTTAELETNTAAVVAATGELDKHAAAIAVLTQNEAYLGGVIMPKKTDALRKQTQAVIDDRTEAEKWADAIQTDSERAEEYADRVDALTQRFKDNEIGSKQLQRELRELADAYKDVDKAIAEATITTEKHVDQQKREQAEARKATKTIEGYTEAHEEKNRSEESQIENMVDLIDKYVKTDTLLGKVIERYRQIKEVLEDLGELKDIEIPIPGVPGGGGGGGGSDITDTISKIKTAYEIYGQVAGEGFGVGLGKIAAGGAIYAPLIVGIATTIRILGEKEGPQIDEILRTTWANIVGRVDFSEPMTGAFDELEQTLSRYEFFRGTAEEIEALREQAVALGSDIAVITVGYDEFGNEIVGVTGALQRAGKEFGATATRVVEVNGEFRVLSVSADNATQATQRLDQQTRALADGVVTAKEVASIYGVTLQTAQGILDGTSSATNALGGESQRMGGIFDSTADQIRAFAGILSDETNPGMEEGERFAAAFGDALNGLPRDIQINVNTNYTTTGEKPGDLPGGPSDPTEGFSGGSSNTLLEALLYQVELLRGDVRNVSGTVAAYS